jgi:hypothetical protein
MACLSHAIIYIKQPRAPVVGQADLRKIVAGILRLSKAVHSELCNCFGPEKKVVTERVDHWDWHRSDVRKMADQNLRHV